MTSLGLSKWGGVLGLCGLWFYRVLNIIMSKFSKQEQERFLRDMENMVLDSDSEMEDSFYEKEKSRRLGEISNMRATKQDETILEELKRNRQRQEEMMTEYENEVYDLKQITSNTAMNVIDPSLIQQIKIKVAENSNQSVLVLADERYNMSVLQPAAADQPNLIHNRSFMKKKEGDLQSRKEEEAIRRKIEIANLEREQLNMQNEDKLSMKYQMEHLSSLFAERFVRPKLNRIDLKDAKIQIVSTKLRNTFTNLRPQQVSQSTVLPKNAPEIALKQLKLRKKKPLKAISTTDIKVVSRKISSKVQSFEEVPLCEELGKKDGSEQTLQKIFLDYIGYISKFISEIEQISKDYSPKFLKYLQASEKNVNYEFDINQGGDGVKKQKLLSQVASLQNAHAFKQIKLTFESITNLKGIEKFVNIEDAQLQFNAVSLIQPLQSCNRLIQLNLSYNKIKNIGQISDLSWLRLLNVEHNLIRVLGLSCKSLQIVYAGHNFIEDLDLNRTKYLRVLALNNNKLNQLPKLKLFNLEELNLSKNQLRSIQNLQQLILLKKLDLSGNRLEQLGETIIYLYLNELNLSHNYLNKLNRLFLPCLERLYLNNNRLCTRSKCQIYLPNLKELNLDENRLQGFSLIWQLLIYSRSVEIIKYNNNEYFLNLRQKIRQIYEYIIYKYMSNIKIINESQLDIGIKKYLEENYDIYYNNIEFFKRSSSVVSYIENSIKFILHQFNFSRQLESTNSSFIRQREYIYYQSIHKIDRLKHIVLFVKKYSLKDTAQSATPSLFYHHDQYELNRRNLHHQVRTLVLLDKRRKQLRFRYFKKQQPTISKGLQYLWAKIVQNERRKAISQFKILLKGNRQNQAAIKIQKVWRGYVRRKLYRKLKNMKKGHSQDSDFEDIDTDFFDKQLEHYEFDLDIEGMTFDDIIIRPQVFEMLQQKQKKEAVEKSKRNPAKQQKEQQKGPLMNNFLESQKKFNKQSGQLSQQEKLMKQWRITDPQLLKTLQYKQQKREQVRRKEMEKNLTAAERYERFKRGNK